jgi:hypothetical protein
MKHRRWLATAMASLVIAGCASAPRPSPTPAASEPAQPSAGSPAPSAAVPSAAAENLTNGPNPPPGDAVRIDHATLSDDGVTLKLEFVGARDYSPSDPCSAHYFGWAHEADGVLQAKVVDDTPPFPSQPPNFGCDDVGYGHTITIALEQPFTGNRLRDVAGFDHFVRRPEGLVDLILPAGWTADVDQEQVLDRQTVWFRTWARGSSGGTKTGGGVELYQAFGQPADVVDASSGRSVRVNGSAAMLYRDASSGEIVVTWMLGPDGLALVANEADFNTDQLIRLAESITQP